VLVFLAQISVIPAVKLIFQIEYANAQPTSHGIMLKIKLHACVHKLQLSRLMLMAMNFASNVLE
jgi:hypothetical protein